MDNMRQDITGLRAIAVISVVLFHITHVFKPSGLSIPGGFIGVDIFFVISGYLMTKIIVTGIREQRFSFWEFYKRRAKRICPALLVVVIVSTSIAILLFRSDPIRQTCREALVSLGFISNFRFARALDYFDGGDFSHLFLHTWSLSVEFQFYLLYPLLIAITCRFLSTNALPKVLAILCLASYITALIWTDINPRQSYYLLPSRACELLVGSLAFFYPIELLRDKLALRFNAETSIIKIMEPKLVEIVGVFILIVSFIVVNNEGGWPNGELIFPMLGTWLCIAANNRLSILRGRVFQSLGIWSYALYLVHWPIIVFSSALGWAQYALLLLLPILLSGYILHVLVERRRNFGYKFTVVYFGLTLAINTVDSKDLISAYKVQSSDMYELYGGEYIHEGETILLGSGEPEFILHGDSHSRELVQVLAERGLSFISNNQNNCYSIGWHSKNKYESDSNFDELDIKCNGVYKRTKLLAKHYDGVPLVVVQNWPVYGHSEPLLNGQNDKPFHLIEDFDTLVEPSEQEQFLYSDLLKLAQDFSDRTIYILGKKQENPFFETNSIPNYALISLWAVENFSNNKPKYVNAPFYKYSINNVLKNSIDRINHLRESGDALAKLIYVDPNIYCHNNECDLFVSNGIQIYSDAHHYSWAGAVKAVSNLLSYMKLEKGTERSKFSSLPDIDFNEIQTVLEYSEESGFKFPDKK